MAELTEQILIAANHSYAWQKDKLEATEQLTHTILQDKGSPEKSTIHGNSHF